MTHFVGIVVADSQEDIARLVAPYDETLKVEPYFEAVDVERMVEYAKEKGEPFENPIDLVEWWNGTPGVTNESGEIGYMSTYNPDSKWDWYVVGGRWNDIVPGNQCLAEQVESAFESRNYLPSVIIDEDGWHTTKDWGWFGSYSLIEGKENIVKEKLAQHKGKIVYIVDFHI